MLKIGAKAENIRGCFSRQKASVAQQTQILKNEKQHTDLYGDTTTQINKLSTEGL